MMNRTGPFPDPTLRGRDGQTDAAPSTRDMATGLSLLSLLSSVTSWATLAVCSHGKSLPMNQNAPPRGASHRRPGSRRLPTPSSPRPPHPHPNPLSPPSPPPPTLCSPYAPPLCPHAQPHPPSTRLCAVRDAASASASASASALVATRLETRLFIRSARAIHQIVPLLLLLGLGGALRVLPGGVPLLVVEGRLVHEVLEVVELGHLADEEAAEDGREEKDLRGRINEINAKKSI